MGNTAQIQEMAYLICSTANKPESCSECGDLEKGCSFISQAKTLYDAGFRKEENDESEMPFCGDCLCRVCANSKCQGCGACTGVVETEDDCVQEFISCGDNDYE